LDFKNSRKRLFLENISSTGFGTAEENANISMLMLGWYIIPFLYILPPEILSSFIELNENIILALIAKLLRKVLFIKVRLPSF